MINPKEHFIFTNIHHEGQAWVGDWEVPEDLPYFDGHFPSEPILPAVGLLDGSLCAIEMAGFYMETIKIKKAKFKQKITPKLNLEIKVMQFEGAYQVTWNQKGSKRWLVNIHFEI